MIKRTSDKGDKNVNNLTKGPDKERTKRAKIKLRDINIRTKEATSSSRQASKEQVFTDCI